MLKKIIVLLFLSALLFFILVDEPVDLAESSSMSCEELIYTSLIEEQDAITLIPYHLSPEELDKCWNNVIFNNADLFYVSNRFTYKAVGDYILTIYPAYAVTGEELVAAREIYNNALDKILKTVHPQWTDLQTALYLNDYLCTHFVYDNSLTKFSAYELLTESTGVCQAYILVYNALLTACGIDCTYVISNDMNHAWNVVTIDNQRYNVDVTFNDPIPDHLGKVSHDNFLRSDEYFSLNHTYTFEEGYGQCENIYYDKYAVWQDVNTAFIPIDDNFYYIQDNKIYCWDGELSESVHKIRATWYTDRGDNSYWQGDFSSLWLHEDKLLYNKPDSIVAYDPITKKTSTFYTYKGSEDIYGFAIFDNILYLQLSKTPNEIAKLETIQLQ